MSAFDNYVDGLLLSTHCGQLSRHHTPHLKLNIFSNSPAAQQLFIPALTTKSAPVNPRPSTAWTPPCPVPVRGQGLSVLGRLGLGFSLDLHGHYVGVSQEQGYTRVLPFTLYTRVSII